MILWRTTASFIGKIARSRLVEEAKKRNSLDRQIDTFVVRNCPLNYAVHSIRALGISICFEAIITEPDWYVDPEGVAVFATDKPITIELTQTTPRKILEVICNADPRYNWTDDAKHGLIVLAPSKNSRLKFPVAPVKDSGNPRDVLEHVSRNMGVTVFAPGGAAGDNNLPDVVLKTSRCPATDFLNQMVAQHPGMTWGFGGRVSFNYMPNTMANAVRIEFPPVTKGEPHQTGWHYTIVEHTIDGVSTVVVEKRQMP